MKVKYGCILKKYRENAGFSLEDISNKFDVPVQLIENWENDICEPNRVELIALASIYNVSVSTLKGIKIESIEVDDDGVHVTNNHGEELNFNGEGMHFKSAEDVKRTKKLKLIELLSGNITILIVTIIYIILGCLLKDGSGWRNYWVLYFLVPVIPSIFTSIRKNNAAMFNIPMLTTGVYLAVGMFTNIWHPTWVIFLAIPVYYSFCKIFENKE